MEKIETPIQFAVVTMHFSLIIREITHTGISCQRPRSEKRETESVYKYIITLTCRDQNASPIQSRPKTKVIVTLTFGDTRRRVNNRSDVLFERLALLSERSTAQNDRRLARSSSQVSNANTELSGARGE